MVIVAALATAGGALAISNGTPDGDAHPYVGLVRLYDEDGVSLGRCSGALLSPTVFLTAGHCASGASRADVYFQSTDAALGDPARLGNAVRAPEFDGLVTFPNTSDVGVVVLDERVVLPGGYAKLAPLGYLDQYAKISKKKAAISFTAVGYGLQDSHPVVVAAPDRYQATTLLVSLVNHNTDGWNLRTSNNAVTGGTCPGDSGGPFLVEGNTVVSVNSFSMSGHCSGADYSYRVDTEYAQDWLAQFLEVRGASTPTAPRPVSAAWRCSSAR